MTLPSSGPLSLLDIQTEFGGSNPISLSEYYAGGGLVPAGTSGTYGAVPSSGEISVRNFYGTSNRVSIAFTYASNTQEASLNISTIPGYVSGASDVVVTINAGVYIWSDNTSVPALYLFGGTSGDVVTLINNGFIMGRGGNGGTRTTSGTPGGTALSIGRNVTINNTNGGAYIGGGGGGGGSCNSQGTAGSGGGGGAGGGAGGDGGAGGSIGNVGGNGIALSGEYYAGAGGGRIFPGVGGAGGTAAGAVASGGGAGGGGAGYRVVIFSVLLTGTGGGGGSANAVGGNGVRVQNSGGAGGGGGGWGASGGNGQVANDSVFIPGVGGKAVQLNGNTVTWVSGDTSRVYGAVSF